MTPRIFIIAALSVAFDCLANDATGPHPDLSVTSLPSTVTQNFDTLPASGTATWVNDVTLPGWFQARTISGTDIVANDGNNSAGNLYSFGTGTNTDRALGSIGSNSVGDIFWGILLTNNAGSTITSLHVVYTGEQWRNGAAAAQTVSFSYVIGTGLTGSLADFQSAGPGVTELDFASPITGGTAGPLNGNLAANRAAKAFTILNLNIANGQSILLRWADPNHAGVDHGLAIDDFSVTANGAGGPTPTATPPTTPTPTPLPSLLQVHDIQGSGNTSPFVGLSITTTGVVTGLRSNGFFLQTPDASVDANPSTSEGVFVFTSSAPVVAIGSAINVTGTVAEFTPPSDPTSLPLTEITSPAITLNSTGNPLPAAVFVSAADTLVNDVNNLEKYEGMRVLVSSLTVVGPTSGTVTETSATSVSNGVFFGVVTGVTRPMAEPGIPITSSVPSPAPANVPRFDTNPERIRVDSDAQPGAVALNVTGGAVLTNLIGVLDYAFDTYTILPDAAPPPGVSGNVAASPVPAPTSTQLTVACFNLERFFDTIDDPGIADSVLTATAFNNRLNKTSLAIRNILRFPDVIGVEEMEKLTTLQALANKINNDAVAAAQPNPNYTAFLTEGNDAGGIDVGFLVKTARITVIDVTQFGLTATYINPNNGQPELLNDRPPLVLRATVQDGANQSFAFTVIVNHLRSLNGVDDPMDGHRVRTKRRAQAEFLANLVQGRQVSNPAERLFLVGDLNAFQFNDGYVDVIGTILGTPTPGDQVVLASADLVNPDLTDLVNSAPADQRYSFSFVGSGNVLDHIIVTGNLLSRIDQITYARFDADFPESFRNDSNRPERISDHDAPVVYVSLAAPTPTPTPPATVMISGSLFYCSNPTPGPVPGVTLTLTGTSSGSTSSDGSGDYSLAGLPSGGSFTVTPSKAVLAPASAGISTVDVLAAQRHFLALVFLTGCRLTAADVNGDTGVNTVDVIAIQRFFLGFATGIVNVGKYQFNPVSRSYSSLTSNQVGQNYDTLVFGDAASPFVVP